LTLRADATPGLDQEIINAITRSHGYRLVSRVPYGASNYVIWERM